MKWIRSRKIYLDFTSRKNKKPPRPYYFLIKPSDSSSNEFEIYYRQFTLNSPYVFDTGRQIGAQGHIHADTLTGAITRLRRAAASSEGEKPGLLANIELFSLHDLRRSAATAWGEYLKTPPHIVERMLNHQPLNKLVATYQHALYLNEQKAAWNQWGEMIENICINDSNKITYLKLKVV